MMEDFHVRPGGADCTLTAPPLGHGRTYRDVMVFVTGWWQTFVISLTCYVSENDHIVIDSSHKQVSVTLYTL